MQPLIGFEVEFLYDPISPEWHEVFTKPNAKDTRKVKPEEDGAPWNHRKIFAARLEEKIGQKVVAAYSPRKSKRGSGSKPRMNWSVVPEIGAYDDDVEWWHEGAVEVVSPPMTFDEFSEVLPSISDFVDENGYCSINCGLHLNISVPMMYFMDPLMLSMSMREKHWLDYYGRTDKFETIHDHLSYLYVLNSDEWEKMSDADLAATLRSQVPDGKQFSTNIDRWRSGYGYVEFRHPGGKLWQSQEGFTATRECAEELKDSLLRARESHENEVIPYMNSIRETATEMMLNNVTREIYEWQSSLPSADAAA